MGIPTIPVCGAPCSNPCNPISGDCVTCPRTLVVTIGGTFGAPVNGEHTLWQWVNPGPSYTCRWVSDISDPVLIDLAWDLATTWYLHMDYAGAGGYAAILYKPRLAQCDETGAYIFIFDFPSSATTAVVSIPI